MVSEPSPNPVLLIPPSSRCLVCGAGGGGEAKDSCPRCGATGGDVRSLLRAGSAAYAEARLAALKSDFADARRHLAAATSLGVGESDQWRELSVLVAAADPAVPEADARAYGQARAFAVAGRFAAADAIPLPATPAADELGRLRAAGVTWERRVRRQNVFRSAAAGMAGAVGFALLSLAFRGLPAPRPDVSEIPKSLSSPRPLAARNSLNDTRPFTNIGRGARLSSPAPFAYPYPERLTRRYYNDALRAYREKRFKTAADLSDLAAISGADTYLLPHILLLRARIADTIPDANAPLLWAEIASRAPRSPYAPLGLLRAAERSRKISGEQEAGALFLAELIRRYPLSKEACIARKRLNPARRFREEIPR